MDPADREEYLSTLRQTLRVGGHLVMATFGPEGPEVCSGLRVCRYGATDLAEVLAGGFDLISSSLSVHHSPSGTPQQFLYSLFVRTGE